MPLPQALKEKLEKLPAEPGVYIMRDRRGEVIYVGKALSLRSRVRSYFSRGGGDGRAFVSLLDELLGDIEVLQVGSEQEALLLENELIKRHKPRFNVLLRDDKDFVTLRLDTSHAYPRLEVWRRPEKDGARYFGPYASSHALRQTLAMVNRHFRLRTCSDQELARRKRPCLQHQIGRCPAPCVREVADYVRNVEDTILFLEGKHTELVEDLSERMKAASEALDFEEAARLRDHLRAVERVLERQRVVQVGDQRERHVVGFYREGPALAVQVLEVRRGRLCGGRSYIFSDQEFPTPELLGSLIMQIYGAGGTAVPDEILLPCEVEGMEALAAWLSEARSRKVALHVPRRGEKRRLVELAMENAKAAFVMERSRERDDRELLERLQKALDLRRLPRRIECFDISQIQGHAPVASRVAMLDARPDKARYRHYRIRGVTGQDDFAMMREALFRRLSRGAEEGDLPDLLVVDGGKGQLGVARAVVDDLALGDEVELAALAKSRPARHGKAKTAGEGPTPERVFLPGRKDPVVLPPESAELLLLMRLRDEAHRFAITFHRKLRGGRALHNRLEEIPGVGPARRKALLRAFGSVKALKGSSVEEIAKVRGFSPELAERVLDALGRRRQEGERSPGEEQ